MSGEHISFEKLSDFCDGEIKTNEEQEGILAHIEVCAICKTQYDRILSTFRLLKSYSQADFGLSRVKLETMKQVKRITFKKRFLKMAPLAAVASFVVIISSIVVFNGNKMDGVTVQNGKSIVTEPVEDSSVVFKIIQRNGARVILATNIYIEGEVSSANFSKLRRELGFRKVTYRRKTVSHDNFQDKNLEVASIGAIPEHYYSSDNTMIRFRIYK